MSRFKSMALGKFRIFHLAVLFFVVQGCATTESPLVDPLAYKNRTKSSSHEGVTVTVAVPTIAEAQAIYGVKLASKNIQPVWLEVRNDSGDSYWFLPSGLDPEYFSPSEAAFAFYTDGLRAVLFFESRPNALSDIELLQWEFPSGSVLKKD